ncbi:MAG: NADH-quinone oxidoreductase subunit K [Spirochaetes bacterium]|nr:NADH-quinone oxidoreductase subunit K [Spirochaetota bacterium]
MYYYFAGLLIFIGLYVLVFSRNTMRMLIALEVMVKGVTLVLFAAANATKSQGLGQTLFITMLLIEVIVAVVVLAFIIHTYRQTGSLDIRKLNNLRG